MSLQWRIEGPGDNPLFKPLGVKHIRAKKGSTLRDSDFVGPRSSTRRNNSKTDIVLKFGGKTFQAHKHVLQKASELFKKDPSFQTSESAAKRAKPGSSHPKPTEFDLSEILPEEANQYDTLNKVIDFAYTGRLPLATDVGFKHFFVTVVALHFSEALHVYEMYFINLFKREQRVFPPSAAGIILTECQKIRKPIMLSSCAEYLENIADNTSKYLLKEPLEKLRDDAGFMAYLSDKALVTFLDRDDLAKPAEEAKVCVFGQKL
ncbi:uncharacterized protein [Amphiura filiformis]|uniref:uncharacterized protein n=1 Tax=Amphiura filiformis TaxID=82378 RepID=UPI003B210376